MKIVSSSISLQSTRSFEQSAQASRRVVAQRVPEPARQEQPKSVQRLFQAGARAFELPVKGSAGSVRSSGSVGGQELDPKTAMIKRILEALTGREIPLGSIRDAEPDAPSVSGQPPGPGAAAPVSQGWGLTIENQVIIDEAEATSVTAKGQIVVEGGRTIDFSLGLSMERSFHTETSSLITAGQALSDPLVINFDSVPVELSDTRFSFDLDQDGLAESIPGLAKGSGFLVFDRNRDNEVNDGGELFGPETGSGFSELARLDSDGNGWIDESDPGFRDLYVWEGPGGKLQPLSARGIGALALASVSSEFSLRDAVNRTLGMVRSTGLYLREDGGVGSMQQVDLSV